MSPRFSSINVGDSRVSNTVHVRQHSDAYTLLQLSFYLTNLHLCETGIDRQSKVYSKFNSMLDIFGVRDPFEVGISIVRRDAVFMVNLGSFWFWAKKGFSYKDVDRSVFLPTFSMESNNKPSGFIELLFDDAWFFMSRSKICTLKPTEVGDGVSIFPSHDWLPDFNVRLRVIHGWFLLVRNWFWLEPRECVEHLRGSLILALRVV